MNLKKHKYPHERWADYKSDEYNALKKAGCPLILKQMGKCLFHVQNQKQDVQATEEFYRILMQD